ncbi:hypothetical protein EG328_004754 [Venturia inaequalis]|uniref:Uncharacterized protein n=1 Tax=Venturia inaequalis TaxID=5025 RepID=A0A8H3YTF5_VENIN|nr:hypothetical protein EG328_004754 [Venturia inaequalis]
MPELAKELIPIIIAYRFKDKLTFPTIAKKLPGVTANAAQKLCKRTRERAGSNHLKTLLKNAYPIPRTGRPPRVLPGSKLSYRIRAAGRGKYKCF